MRSWRALGMLVSALTVSCGGASVAPAATPDRWELPAPPGGHGDGTIEADDGTRLYLQAWSPKTSVRATVVIEHGLREHSGRYAKLAREFSARGFAVVAADLRGHGLSAGNRGQVDDMDRLVKDLDQVIELARRWQPAVPVYLYGHSMGGLVAALYAERDRAPIAGLILSAPAIELPISGFEQCGINLIADLAPNAPLLALPMDKWSHDRAAVADNQRDPLVYQEPGPARTVVALSEGAARAREQAPLLRLPLLIQHGGADEITLPSGSRTLYEGSRSSDKSFLIYPGLYHDLLDEPSQAGVLADLLRWLEAHAPAAESEAPALEAEALVGEGDAGGAEDMVRFDPIEL